MVQMKEFRIVMPLSMEEFKVGLSYTISKMEQQNTNSEEGVEVLQNIPFEDEQLGKGHYTSKVYHLHSKIPSWLRSFAPSSGITMQEESWTAFPRCKTVIKCSFFSKFTLTIETVIAPDNGVSENVHGLNDQKLAKRQVEILDITSVSRDYWSMVIGGTDVDLTNFESKIAARGPLHKGWMDSSKPVVTSYKLVTVDAPIWGISDRLEECIISGERALFLASHRLCFSKIDDWYGKTPEQMAEIEKQNRLALQKAMQKPVKNASKNEARKSSMQASSRNKRNYF